MRRSPDFGWLGACVLIAVAVSLISAPAAAQTAGQPAGGTARTTWGDPDLQGVWDFSSNTPLNRPEEFGERAFLTKEEAAQRQQVRVAARDTQDNTSARDGSTGTYNRFWTDNPRETRHTSLVVDPPNGRVPPLTPVAQRRFEELAVARRGVDDDAPMRRPQFSWTRIKGESDVKGGGGHGWVEASAGSWVGADGGSPEGERSQRRRRGGWVGGLGARPAVEREPETGRGVAAAARRVA